MSPEVARVLFIVFPTVHVHDGTVHREADFDHELYWQAARPGHAELPAGRATRVDTASARPADKLDLRRTRDVITDDEALHRVELRGARANTDTRVRL